MEDNLIEVSFDSLKELEYLRIMEEHLRNNLDSIHSESLIYDNHHVLLVAVHIARDYLRIIHFPESMRQERMEDIYIHLDFWANIINENVITPKERGYLGGTGKKTPSDMYLNELLEEVKFEGYVSPSTYPFLLHVNGNPYIPYWHVMKWSKKALRVLKERIKKEEEERG